MKLYKFSEKLPVLGSNIVVVSEESGSIGILEFDLEARKYILDQSHHYYGVAYYTDDPSEDGEYDITCAEYWFYPSSIKVPRKNK